MNIINLKNPKRYTIHSLETYNLVIKMRRETGFGGKKIHNKLAEMKIDVPKRTIDSWIHQNKKPFDIKIIKQIKDSSKELTPEKSYIIGTLCGDGYVSTGYRIGLEVCDKEFADYFEYCLEKVYNQKCSRTDRTRPKENHHYIVSLASKNIVLDLQRYSKSFKTFEWILPNAIINSSKDIQAAFIRGFSDSESNVRVRKSRGEISIYSSNNKSLIQVQNLLSDSFKIKSSINHKSHHYKSSYYISISTYDSLKKFYDEIGFIINRKQDALKQLLGTYKRKGLKKYSKEYKIFAIQLLKQDLKHRQIAKLLGTNHTNIYDWENSFKSMYINQYKI